jgi:ABC-2 type transport system permease protein
MKLLSVLKKDLKLLLRERGELAVLFLLPLAFILPLGLTLGPDAFSGMQGDDKEPLPVLDYDGGEHALSLIESLDESLRVEQSLPLDYATEMGMDSDPACSQAGQACDELVFQAMIENKDRIAVLVIPDGLTADVDAGEYTTVTLRYDPAGDAMKRTQIEAVIKGMAIKLALNKMKGDSFGDFEDMTIYAPDDVKDAVDKQVDLAETTGGEDQEPAFGIESVYPTSYTAKVAPDTFQQLVPGFTVMFGFFIMSYVRSAIRAERLSGTLERTLSLPVHRAALLGGKLLSAMIVGVLQVVAMFAIGRLAFGMGLGRHPLVLLVLAAAMVSAATGLGLAAAALGISGGALIAPLLIGALLGGCMIPIDFMPATVRTIAMIFPQTWARDGFQAVLARGQGLVQVLPQIGVLAAFALVSFAIAVWRFDFED